MAMTLAEAQAHADAFLGGYQRDSKTVLAARKILRAGEHPATARALSRKLAERFISGTAMAEDDVDAIWKACLTDEAFSQARRVLKRRVRRENLLPAASYPNPPSVKTQVEQWAMTTSKDPDLSASIRHDWALKILEEDGLDMAQSSPERLGIAGGIWKRKWEWDGKVESLEQALRYYLAPVERLGVAVKEGYPAINAAFIYDLLAQQTTNLTNRTSLRALAADLRVRITTVVNGNSYWELVTRAEAHFGLRAFHEAASLMAAAAAQPDPWERETTARQLVRLGDALDLPRPETRWIVGALLGAGPGHEAAVQSVLVGKVGLALSGGGFRASLYHLGVLARLAESDLLRHVEVLSTVSGGSIVGAAYYLRLRTMLGSQANPSRQDYVELVDALIADFRTGVASNIRSSLLTDLAAVHAVLANNDTIYAQSVAKALFDNIYAPTVQADPHMADLAIVPAGAPPDFHPRYHNLQRAAKVPALLLNATALNTGHSWQFTTTSMGESPFSIVAGADPLPRLRRAYYVNTSGTRVAERTVTLSQAVAASACVPGLFAPLAIKNLYEGYDVRLVDGGVYDNQGSLALLQEDCKVLIVSDACGQLGLATAPEGGRVRPLLRAFDIFQERMRQENYENLRGARQSGRVAGLALVHLTWGLEELPVDWIHCEDPSRQGDQLPPAALGNPETPYQVLKTHQKLLAALRTDLDVFSDTESAALMASGYLAMNLAIEQLFADVPELKADRNDRNWFFTPIMPRLTNANDQALEAQLRAGATQFLRIMQLDSKVRRIIWGLVGVVVIAVALILWATWDVTFPVSVGWIAVMLALLVLPVVLKSKFTDLTLTLADPLGALRSWASRWVAALGIWAMARWLVPKLTARYLEKGALP